MQNGNGCKYNAGLIDFGTNKETGEVELVKVNDRVSVKELGAGIFAGAGTIMNAIVEDTKKLGGDDSYQIDIGV